MEGGADLGRIIQWAGECLGFDPGALRLARLAETARVETQRLGSSAALRRALDEREPRLEAALVAAITVGETYFFRQREHFDLLAQLPALGRPRMLVWSAGCSTGEETYSLASVLRSLAGLEAPALTVWGTDINDASLAQARGAQYGRWSWRDSSSKRPQETRVLEPATRACVRFAKHNLVEDPIFDGNQGERFDLVFCRNVLVYFSAPAAAKALDSITGALRPGAWLVLGNTDLPGAPRGLRRIGPPALCVYEKPARAAEHPLAPFPAAVARRWNPPPATPASPMPRPTPAEDLAVAAQEPVAWHQRALALIEDGQRVDALAELERLTRQHGAYLPGRFEYALALRRDGQAGPAARELRTLLAQVEGRSLDEDVPGPEPLSLEFYVTSARSFISSLGGEA